MNRSELQDEITIIFHRLEELASEAVNLNLEEVASGLDQSRGDLELLADNEELVEPRDPEIELSERLDVLIMCAEEACIALTEAQRIQQMQGDERYLMLNRHKRVGRNLSKAITRVLEMSGEPERLGYGPKGDQDLPIYGDL